MCLVVSYLRQGRNGRQEKESKRAEKHRRGKGGGRKGELSGGNVSSRG
jgi:hypothetical protein